MLHAQSLGRKKNSEVIVKVFVTFSDIPHQPTKTESKTVFRSNNSTKYRIIENLLKVCKSIVLEVGMDSVV